MTQLLGCDKGFNTNAKKSCRDITNWVAIVTPHSRGSVDYPSTRGIQVDVGVPDATSENQVESPLYEELYPNKTPT